jgi:hypothetical protein
MNDVGLNVNSGFLVSNDDDNNNNNNNNSNTANNRIQLFEKNKQQKFH